MTSQVCYEELKRLAKDRRRWSVAMSRLISSVVTAKSKSNPLSSGSSPSKYRQVCSHVLSMPMTGEVISYIE